MSTFEKAHQEAKAGMAEHMAEEKAKSERKVLHHTKWLEMIDKDGYIFMSSPWCDGQGVVVLPYRVKEYMAPFSVDGPDYITQYLLMMEKRPCHGDVLKPYSLTGGCDKKGETPAETAARELREEAGYIVDAADLIPLGIMRESKASDMVTHVFAARIYDDTPFEEPQKDGTSAEADAYGVWMSESQATWDSDDPLVSHAILRLQNRRNRPN